MPIYKMMKVFDCQWDPGMPDDVKKAFFDSQFDTCCNDVYVAWDVELGDSDYDSPDEIQSKRRLVDQWLIDNGANSGETVLIKHWW